MKTATQEKTNSQEQEMENTSNAKPVLAGLLIGGLAGAGAMLLLAPQSGKETRAQLQQKTMELRERTAETVDDAMSQVKSKTSQVTASVRGKAEELHQQGQDILIKQLDHVSNAVEASKTAVKNS